MTQKMYPRELAEGLMNCRSLFSEINQKYWADFEQHIPAGDQKYVLVDFLVGHPGYLIGNAIITKYLQYMYGYKPLVLVPNPESTWLIDIAKSYGFEEFVYESDGTLLSIHDFDSLPFAHAKSEEELRSLILNMEINDIPIGDLVYDTYLSGKSPGTINAIDHKLKEAVLGSLYYFSLAKKLFNKYDFGALIMGHRVYNRFGIFTRFAIDKDIPVYGRKQRSFPAFTVRRDDTIDSAKNYEYHFDKNEFDQALSLVTPEILAEAKEGVFNGFNGALKHEAHSVNRRTVSREELCEELNLDPQKPIVAIFSHVFTDSPHFCKNTIYDDYKQWLFETLKLARENNNVNWILKAHPHQSLYECTESAEQVFHRYAQGAPHLFLSPNDLHIHTFYNNADAVVTCSGSAGLEFPCMGVPAFTAADSFYGGHGFTNQAASQEEYADNMRNIQDRMEIPEEQQNLALAYWYLCYKFTHVSSHYMPTMKCKAPEPEEEIKNWYP